MSDPGIDQIGYDTAWTVDPFLSMPPAPSGRCFEGGTGRLMRFTPLDHDALRRLADGAVPAFRT